MAAPDSPPTGIGDTASEQALLEAESAAWRDLAMPDYDRAVCALIDRLPVDDARILPLASASLRRDGPTLTHSRACCAERLVAFAATAPEPLRAQTRWLFLVAWLRLGAVAAQGPETIATTPALPEGVVLPAGADPEAIVDPALREQARAAADRHRVEVGLWNAKQQALQHLHRLTALVRASRPGLTDDPVVALELTTAMALAQGLPAELRESLYESPPR